jgi:hypothetical protein
MLRGQTKVVSRAGGAHQVLTNPPRGVNPKIKSKILWANLCKPSTLTERRGSDYKEEEIKEISSQSY